MTQYIDKSALVAEIERRQKIHFNDYHINGNNSPADYGACNALTQILAFIDTLKVKEVDLEKILTGFMGRYAYENSGEYPSAIDIAEYFYELGLKAQKGE